MEDQGQGRLEHEVAPLREARVRLYVVVDHENGVAPIGLHDVDALPRADGRLHLQFSLDEPDGKLLHSLDDAVSFLVFPTGVETGSVLLAGRWSMQEIAASETIARV